MPTFFEIRTKETKGYATLFVRLQSRPLGVNYKMSTGLEVDIPSSPSTPCSMATSLPQKKR